MGFGKTTSSESSSSAAGILGRLESRLKPFRGTEKAEATEQEKLATPPNHEHKAPKDKVQSRGGAFADVTTVPIELPS